MAIRDVRQKSHLRLPSTVHLRTPHLDLSFADLHSPRLITIAIQACTPGRAAFVALSLQMLRLLVLQGFLDLDHPLRPEA